MMICSYYRSHTQNNYCGRQSVLKNGYKNMLNHHIGNVFPKIGQKLIIAFAKNNINKLKIL